MMPHEPGWRPRSGAALLECPLQLRLQQRLDIHLDKYLVANANAAVLQLAVPAYLQVVTINACFPHEADARDRTCVPCGGPERRPPPAQVMHLQDHGPRDAADGQVTGHLVVVGTDALATGTLE